MNRKRTMWLNGWQRLGIVLSVVWSLGVGIWALQNWPTHANALAWASGGRTEPESWFDRNAPPPPDLDRLNEDEIYRGWRRLAGQPEPLTREEAAKEQLRASRRDFVEVVAWFWLGLQLILYGLLWPTLRWAVVWVYRGFRKSEG